MNKDSFLSRASESNSFISESKIVTSLAEMEKSIIISMEKLSYFSMYYMQMKEVIENAKKAQLHHINITSEGICEVNDLGNREMSETDIINLVAEKFKDYSGYCFVVDSGMQYLYVDGKMDGSIKSCLEKTKSMQQQLELLKPVSSIREVFAHFRVTCDYTKTYYNLCFNENGKVKAEIKEQELRNILLQYLNKNMQGEVAVEFCTSYVNDEESVDIYVNDGKQRAIIEVKFSLPKKYYEGATNYSLSQRVGDGIKQLDKYALHLAKDARLVDYGYVFVFYISDLKRETICKHIDKKVGEVMQETSEQLHSIFARVETSDMKRWGTETCT